MFFLKKKKDRTTTTVYESRTMAEGIDFTKFKVAELKSTLRRHELPTQGNKAALVHRLQQHQIRNPVTPSETGTMDSSDQGINPSDSVSQRGSTVSSSSRSARMRAAARKAALQARLSFLDQKHSLQIEQIRLNQSLDRIEVQSQINAAIAEETVYAEFESDNHSSMPELSVHSLPYSSNRRSSDESTIHAQTVGARDEFTKNAQTVGARDEPTMRAPATGVCEGTHDKTTINAQTIGARDDESVPNLGARARTSIRK